MIYIELSSTDVECFLEHVDNTSPLRVALLFSGFDLPASGWPTNAIHCNEVDAFRLLEIARAHCPAAIKRVRDGLRRAGVLVQD